MARRKTGRRTRSKAVTSREGEKLYPLRELARRAGVSLPTAQRYKKLYQDRIPSQGRGRTQRYPEQAVEVFQEIKRENLARRGRSGKGETASRKTGRRKAAKRVGKRAAEKTAGKVSRRAAGRRRSGAKAPAKKTTAKGLLTLTEISRRTGISYPTCVSYVKRYGDRIPHVGEGRKRRFPAAAVEVFGELRAQSRRGRRKKASSAASPRRRTGARGGGALAARMRRVERSQAKIVQELRALRKALEKPLRVTVRRS